MTGHRISGWEWTFSGFLLLLIGGFVIWGYIKILKRSDDPASLIFKTIITFVLAGIWAIVAAPNAAKGGIPALFALAVTLIEALVVAIIWGRTIAGLVANPIGNLY